MSTQILSSDFIVNVSVAFDRLPCHESQLTYFSYKERDAFLNRIPGAFLYVFSTVREGAENRLTLAINTGKPGIKDKYGNNTVHVNQYSITCVACAVRCGIHEKNFDALTEYHEVNLVEDQRPRASVFMDQCFFFCSEKCKEAFELSPVLYV